MAIRYENEKHENIYVFGGLKNLLWASDCEACLHASKLKFWTYKFRNANCNSLLLELFEGYFITIEIQEAADSSLERAEFIVLLSENSAIFINYV